MSCSLTAGGKIGAKQIGELGLASTLMCHCQQFDHHPAGGAFGQCLDQPLEGPGVGLAREELIAIDQLHQRHRLAAQAVDHMMVIDDMAVRAVASRASARQRHEMGAADEQVEPVVVEPDPQPVPDQPRKHGVEHFPQREAAGRSDGDDDFLVIAGAPVGQRLQCRALGVDAGRIAPVLGRHDLVDEAAVGGEIIEVARPAQQQRVADRRLQVTMGALDPAILVGPFSWAMPRLLRVGVMP